MLQSVLQS